MIPRSLSARLLAASAVLLPGFLSLSGYMLDIAFQRSLRAAEAERLKSHIYLLLGAAELENDQFWFPEELPEPRFTQLSSGLYGLVRNSSNDILWRSPSAQLLALNPKQMSKNPQQTGQENFYELIVNRENMFAYDYDVLWEGEHKSHPLRFSVLHSQIPMRAELQSYRAQLWRWLGTLAVLLLITQTLIMRWGLRPLRQLATDLAEVESGRKQQLQGDYPDEIQSVTDNLNQVLSNEQAQRERYRNTLADLAHSLKTPLAVIRGSLDTHLDTHTLAEQVSRMDQIVSHQLQRATLTPQPLLRQEVKLKPLVTRLGSALEKVYRDKKVTFDTEMESGVAFPGDERDLMEVLGNLLENAFKYGNRRVRCNVRNNSSEGGKTLAINIEDDGPGVATAKQKTILERGARADTAQPGQGIGLAVVVDIVSSYGGSIDISRSELGGANFRITLPVSVRRRQTK